MAAKCGPLFRARPRVKMVAAGSGNKRLLEAATRRDWELVEQILDGGFRQEELLAVDEENHHLNTLMLSINWGNSEVALALIELMSPEALGWVETDQGRTALHLAVGWNLEDVAVRLVAKMKEEDIARLDTSGMAFMHLVCCGGTLVRQVLKEMPSAALLLSASGDYPLHIAALEEGLDVAQELVDAMPEEVLLHRNHNGSTALHYAAYCRQWTTEVLELLLDVVPEALAIVDNRGHAPVHHFNEESSVDQRLPILKRMLEGTPAELLLVRMDGGEEGDKQEGGTLLHYWVTVGDVAAVALVREHMPRDGLWITDDLGRAAVEVAQSLGYSKIVALLTPAPKRAA